LTSNKRSLFSLFQLPLRGGVNIARNTGVKFAGIYTVIEGDVVDISKAPNIPDLTYNGKIIDMVELGMILYCAKIFYVNGKPASEKQIFKMLEVATGVSIENHSQRISELKIRQEPLQAVKQWMKMALAHLGNLPEDRIRKKLR
jgi:protein-disulfide isomerase-like protein with CxxC motif